MNPDPYITIGAIISCLFERSQTHMGPPVCLTDSMGLINKSDGCSELNHVSQGLAFHLAMLPSYLKVLFPVQNLDVMAHFYSLTQEP